MSELQKYTPAQIARITDIKEVLKGKGIAEAAIIFYKAQDAYLEASKAQEIKLRCIRQAGFILLPMSQGGMTPREQGKRTDLTFSSGLSKFHKALDDAGITEQTANVWQKVARVPEGKFEAYLAEADYYQDDITIANLLKFAGLWYGRSDIAEWETPQWLFNLLDKEFHFELDVCALPDNTKCGHYFTPEMNGLKQDWIGSCWMNPPYGRTIKDWMLKAKQSMKLGATVVCLVPARPDTEWWWDNCIDGEIRFIKGRLKWPPDDTVGPFPSAVVILRPSNQGGKVVWWDVRPK